MIERSHELKIQLYNSKEKYVWSAVLDNVGYSVKRSQYGGNVMWA